MIETAYDAFLRSTPGRYAVTGSSFVWCASRTLCGAVMWGRQTEAETGAILRIFEEYPRQMADSFDVVLDTRGVDHVEPRCLAMLFSWMMIHRDGLRAHVRLQASVIGGGPIGFLLTGILPRVGQTHPYRLFTEPVEAYRAVTGDVGEALAREVEAILDHVRGVPRELRRTRELVGARADVSLEEVSRTVGMSPRSLQRMLGAHGTSFHQEVVEARFVRAQDLLRTTELKLSAVAAQVGISERALTLLFKAKTGKTPAEWRRVPRA